jgi:ABC-2 type transport system ATP-binding protein
VIISKGALVRAGPLADLAGNGAVRVRVRSPRREALIRALEVPGEDPPPTVLEPTDDGELLVTGLTASDIGRRAFLAGVELHELTQQTNDLESLFLELTATGTPGGTA